ncbi:RHS repeat-associated core domain-containing protein [Paenibacillus sp. 79R4]|uniref:RHS repeat-associated core domain-containing protein n=1 Tax=Paenibacillus sp. 79R4 TaxID=2212847 RepID=UPI002119A707|nr:RHS repeat-associated core domain-containing protein [Paenibacillus sp. 79R4]
MELDETGEVKAYYIYGLGLIGREDAQGQYSSYHSDLRGSTTILTNEQGMVTDRYTYGLYGELEQHEGTTSQPFQYNGRDGVMTDPNGLYYMRARYYHPGLKRFLNRDLIRGDIKDGQTFNRYAYVNGDPVKYVDPQGLCKCELPVTKGTGDLPKVNIDTGTANAFISEGSSIRHELKAYVNGKQMVMTDTAAGEFRNIINGVAGPLEKARAERFMNRVQVIPDNRPLGL